MRLVRVRDASAFVQLLRFDGGGEVSRLHIYPGRGWRRWVLRVRRSRAEPSYTCRYCGSFVAGGYVCRGCS